MGSTKTINFVLNNSLQLIMPWHTNEHDFISALVQFVLFFGQGAFVMITGSDQITNAIRNMRMPTGHIQLDVFCQT